MVSRPKILQFLIGLLIVIKYEILLFPLSRHTLDIRDMIAEILESNVDPLIFLAEDNQHNIADLQLTNTGFPSSPANIEVMHIKIVDIEFWVRLKEVFLVVETESKCFKTLEEQFHILPRDVLIRLLQIAIEDILCIVGIILIQEGGLRPEPSLNEAYLHLLACLLLNNEPDVTLMV